MKNLDEYRISIIDLVDFIYEQKESGGLDFDQELSEEIDDLHQAVCDAREQLEGEHYDRLVFTMKGPVEGAEVFAAVDRIRDMAHEYYKEVYVVGDATSNYDLSSSFQTDNVVCVDDQRADGAVCRRHPAVYLPVRRSAGAAGADHPGQHLDQFFHSGADGNHHVFLKLSHRQFHPDGSHHWTMPL